MQLLHLETRRARILINCLSSRDIGTSLKEVLVKRSLERRIEAVQLWRDANLARGQTQLFDSPYPRTLSLSRSQTFVHLRTTLQHRRRPRRRCEVFMSDTRRRKKERETKEIYVCICTTDARLLLTRVPMVLHSFSTRSLSPFLFSFASPFSSPHVARMRATLRHDDTQKRILTDWKPFTIDGTPRHGELSAFRGDASLGKMIHMCL